MDPQGHLTQEINLNPDELRWTIGDALLNQATLVEVSRETPVYNLDITT